MTISLYLASVPILQHYLKRLHATLDIAKAHAYRCGSPESALLGARLTDGMFLFAQQVSTACGFALRACCPLLHIDVPEIAGGDKTFEQLQDRIAGTLQFLKTLPAERISDAEDAIITTTAGFAQREFTGRDYVLCYALPNFFFHLSMAHAILRMQGVAIGKQDFDGYHAYPAGFSFPEQKDS